MLLRLLFGSLIRRGQRRFRGVILVLLMLAGAYEFLAPNATLMPNGQRLKAQSAPVVSAAMNDPVLTRDRATHILYGDRTGGGHMHGMGKPCKSEFPADWDADEIISTVQQIAANDNMRWQKQSNGNHVTEAIGQGGIKLRVVLNDDKTKIITAYPINVKRNPCNAVNDNDN